MAKPEWGTKRSCESCGAKFYDFQRDPIICPKCDTKFTVTAPTRSRRNRTARPVPVAVQTPKPVKDEGEVPAEVDDIADDDDTDGDVKDDKLLDDEDDLEGEVIDVNAGGDADDKET